MVLQPPAKRPTFKLKSCPRQMWLFKRQLSRSKRQTYSNNLLKWQIQALQTTLEHLEVAMRLWIGSSTKQVWSLKSLCKSTATSLCYKPRRTVSPHQTCLDHNQRTVIRGVLLSNKNNPRWPNKHMQSNVQIKLWLVTYLSHKTKWRSGSQPVTPCQRKTWCSRDHQTVVSSCLPKTKGFWITLRWEVASK